MSQSGTKRPPNASSSSSVSHSPITTFIRQDSLFVDGEDDKKRKGDAAMRSIQKTSPLAAKSLRLIGLEPHRSRTQATMTLLSNWEGRDAILQFAQSISLLLYSLAPIRRRQLHIASESVANLRKVLVLAKWISEGSEVVHQQWLAQGGEQEGGEDSNASTESEHEGFASVVDEAYAEKRLASHVQGQAARSWSSAWQRRVGEVGEYMVMLGEGCELAALLGGSGVLWRVIGGKLAARQRKGLERIALVFLAVGFSLALRHVAWLRRRRLYKLRKANGQLIGAIDGLNAEADAKTIFGGHHLSAEEAIVTGHRKKGGGEAKKRGSDKKEQSENAVRKAERKVFLQRKKMQLLRLERASIRAELLFVLAELIWPQHDHTRLEAWTTLIAALCQMSRLTKEKRWQ